MPRFLGVLLFQARRDHQELRYPVPRAPSKMSQEHEQWLKDTAEDKKYYPVTLATYAQSMNK